MNGQREPFQIVVTRGLWRGVDVMVQPPRPSHSLRHFRDHGKAMTYAEDLARVTGWPVRNLVESEA